MPEFSNYVEGIPAAATTTGTILIPASHDGDAESFTPTQIVAAGGGGGGGWPLTGAEALTGNVEMTGDFNLSLGTSANHLNALSVYTETTMLLHAQDAFQVDVHDDLTTDVITISSTPKTLTIQAGDLAQTTVQISDEDGGVGVLLQTDANPINLTSATGDINLSGASVTVPNVAAGDNSTKAANTAFVQTKTDQLTTFRRLTASHTLDSTDLASINNGDDLVIEMNVASANDLTIPLNATVAFPIGTKITIIQYGVGQTSVVATGGVTANTSSGDFLSRNQYAPMLLEKVATDEWYLSNGTTPGSIVSAGTWTPTLTNTTNVAASTAYACQYMRVGATVTVSGKVSIDPTTTGDTVLGMSIPIPSAFSQEFHAGGVAAAYAVEGLSVAILADTTNDRLTFRFTAVDTSNRDFFFSATYQII